MASITTSTIGYPRIGPKREMKTALEAFWSGKSSEANLMATSNAVDEAAWRSQADAGVQLIALDGTLYDHVADFAVTYLGLVPERFRDLSGLELYFGAARGTPSASALDMSKHFDTNYHSLTPELSADSRPNPNWQPLLDRVRRGQAAVGKSCAVPILVGPLTLTALSRGQFDRDEMVSRLVPAYVQVLESLRELGVPEVQIHEPVLATGKAAALRSAAEAAFAALSAPGVPLHLVIPYDDVPEEAFTWVTALPVHAIGLDFCGVPGAAHGNLTTQLINKYGFPSDKRLGAGVIDGRSVWADDGTAVRIVAALRARLGPQQAICVQSSTSLQHVPIDSTLEAALPSELIPRLAFATQKLREIVLTAAATGDSSVDAGALDLATWTGAPAPAPSADIPVALFSRSETYAARRPQQPAFPAFPTTTIGSFPQTPSIRRSRLQFKKGQLSEAEYKERIAAEIGYAVGVQEALGLDVLVHGEAERSDMVEYFGLKLDGFVFTEAGWVQSYGSRYVRPPIIAGDVSRAAPMTVHEFKLAQSVTHKPVKGMLTGPCTILNWSFPRKDLPRSAQAYQVALALREEVADLEAAGCVILQVDEPAIREGLPLKAERWDAYLDWATKAFRLATGVAQPSTQIVTHLCYSQFEDILPAIDALDADVLTIENSRSDDEMIRALTGFGYSRDLGPGVYDVHSPVVPTVEFMAAKIRSFLGNGILNGDATRIHVNPDCGLKTRKWDEVVPSLRNMVEAAATVRKELGKAGVNVNGNGASAGATDVSARPGACDCC